VLAFSLLEGEGAGASKAIGDVVISVDTAIRQATEIGHDLEAEIDRLLVHGILHLVGYDHERSATEARRMRRKERQCLAALDPAGRGRVATRRPSRSKRGTR
jgi:probable rRNA maturation factor